MARTRLPNEAAIGCNIMTCCIQMAGSVNSWTWEKTNIKKFVLNDLLYDFNTFEVR
jgi:hypothetical protein